jgi:hypothetical protein
MREKAAGKGNAVFIQIMVSSLIYLLPLGFSLLHFWKSTHNRLSINISRIWKEPTARSRQIK